MSGSTFHPKTYLMDYEIFDEDGISLKKGRIKVKNKRMEFEAKCALEDYLKKKNPLMHRLVISYCREFLPSPFGDIPSDIDDIWSNLFGGNKK